MSVLLRRPSIAAVLVLLLGSAAASAQTAAAPAASATGTKPAAGTPSDKPAPPQQTSVVCKDGVQIFLTYFPSNRGKDAVPVVLLHMFKGDRHEMEGLGLYLQSQGHAVIAPDLRGHGDSKLYQGKVAVEPARLLPVQFFNMVGQDMEAVKKFLVEKHNAAELNVDKLCLIGAEMGAAIAFNWAAADWAAYDLPTLKQSKDVKAVVLLSPQPNFKGLSMNKALAFEPFRSEIAAFMIAGAEDTESAADAKRMKDSLDRGRPKPTKIEDKTVFLENTLKTKLVGSKLLGEKSLGVDEVIGQFIQLRLANRPDLPWKERKAP